jgi:hypothetical protein
MTTSEERLKILKMIQEGKLTAQEGAELMEELDGRSSEPTSGSTAPAPGGSRPPRWLHIVVTDTNSGKARVNVRLPISLVNAGIKMGARFAPEVQGLDSETLLEHLRAGETGKIVDVLDDEDGEHVEVYIE